MHLDSITSAIMGALAKRSQPDVRAAFEQLKQLLERKLEGNVAAALAEVEQQPASASRQAVLADELAFAQAEQDAELEQAAQEVLQHLEQVPGGKEILQQIIKGNYNIVAGGNVTIYLQSGELRPAADLLPELRIKSWQYYDELTGLNGPYRNLNIAEAILAGIKEAQSSISASYKALNPMVKESYGQVLGLEEHMRLLWQQPMRHALLLGEGGMGKTSSLLYLWHRLLESGDHRILPLFVPLHEYNSVSESERTNFVAGRIAWHYLGKRESEAKTINALWQVFAEKPENNAPTVVLLLDGFNEVTAENRPLLLELQDLRQKGLAVQLVLTSRYEMNFSWAEGFHMMVLQPLSLQGVKDYLVEHMVPYPEGKRLQSVLQNPMMLTLYASANETVVQYQYDTRFSFTQRTTTQGELLANYLEVQLVKLNRIYGDDTYEYLFYKFILRHFLPYLGYMMEHKAQYSFAANEFTNIINQACANFNNQEFVESNGEYGRWIGRFDLFEHSFFKAVERKENYKKVLCQYLGIMQEAGDGIMFLHQNFRDIFSSLYIYNDMCKCVKKKQLTNLLTQRPLPSYLRKYIGEISGEVYQLDAFVIKHTAVSDVIECVRNEFHSVAGNYAIWNLVHICKDARLNLAGLDFHAINLLGVSFYKAFCFQKDRQRSRSASFDGSLLNDESFFPQGHIECVNAIAFSPDGQSFLTGSSDRTVKHWDVATGKCLATFSGHSSRVSSVAFSPDGQSFLAGADDGLVRHWDLATGECINKFYGPYGVTSIAISLDGCLLLASFKGGLVKSWGIKSGDSRYEIVVSKGQVDYIKILSDNSFVLLADNRVVKQYDMFSGQCSRDFKHIPGILIAGCSFENLHPDSSISKDSIELMRQYGAIFDQEDQQRWNEAISQLSQNAGA